MKPSNPKVGKAKWLEIGYKHFAEYGPKNMSVNKISGEIGVSRASFYHHFGDIGIFMDELLTMHWLFTMQLFHARSTPEFNFLFIKTVFDFMNSSFYTSLRET